MNERHAQVFVTDAKMGLIVQIWRLDKSNLTSRLTSLVFAQFVSALWRRSGQSLPKI